MNEPRRILSVAPRYVPGVDGATGGHYTVYQDDLQAAAGRLGLPFVILASRGLAGPDGIVSGLDITNDETIAESLVDSALPGDLVMFYEGSLGRLEALAPVAATRPDVRFVVNLFRPEPGLAPSERRRSARQSVAVPHAIPPNVIVTAETESRVGLARGLGIPCAGAWRLHTTLWDTIPEPAPSPSAAEGEHDVLRVLVPLADRGYRERVVRDIAQVLAVLARHPEGRQVQLSLTGGDSLRFEARVRGPRLESLGARRVVGPPGREAYARLFSEHDVVWIPERFSYRTQSSGKTLDALVLGRPVIAQAGTWPVRESSRWVGEELSYEDLDDAVRLLTDLTTRIASVHARLGGLSPSIRAAHAPEATLLRVLEVAGAELPTPWTVPNTLPGFGPRIAGWADGGGRVGGSLLARAAARLRARQAAVIGPRLRAERALRRRIAGVRSRP